MLKKLLNLINNPNFNFTYIFARFKSVRTISKYLKYFLRKISKKNSNMGEIKKKDLILIRYKPIPFNKNYVDLNISTEDIVNKLKNDGLHEGFNLKRNVLKNLIELSNDCKLIHSGNKKIFNNLDEVNSYNLNNKYPCTIVDLINDSENEISEMENLVDEISRDKNLLTIADKYLGKVNKIYTRFSWSTVCDSDSKWRENEQTVYFHYDVHDFGFVYVFFYLTDCDKLSGAHEVILGSHKKKKISHLIGPAKANEDKLKVFYNKNNFKIIEGNMGHGFIEDTSAFHKAHAPIKKPRLALQIRYH